MSRSKSFEREAFGVKITLCSLLITLSLSISASSRTAPSDVTSAAPPANDLFSNAFVLNGPNHLIFHTNVDATSEPGEPLFNPTNKTVWYSFTPTQNISFTVETSGDSGATLNDTIIAVFTGSAVNALTPLVLNDDINGVQNRKSRVTFIANAGTAYKIQVAGFLASQGAFTLRTFINKAEANQFNFNGDIKSDFGVFRPGTTWYISLPGEFKVVQWGAPGDRLMPQDYDGDGLTDVAVWRPSNGTFYVMRSQDATFQIAQWGLSTDTPVHGDFDGDDHADMAVWRGSSGDFYVRRSSQNGSLLTHHWGASGDTVACGDFDGDGFTDFGIKRSVGGLATFYIYRSSNGSVYAENFGLAADQIVPGDYDNDGKNDIAVYRNATHSFYYLRSSDGEFRAIQWGADGDVPISGNYVDYESSDLCVWRIATGTFYCYGDGGRGAFSAFQFGQNGDIPIGRSNVNF